MMVIAMTLQGGEASANLQVHSLSINKFEEKPSYSCTSAYIGALATLQCMHSINRRSVLAVNCHIT